MNIPGYYYDPEKGRYFKIENSKTAPTNAAWSSNNVKRQKLRNKDAATALRHLNLARSRIKRARVLHEPLTGGFFAREYGAMKDDMQAACFVEGLRDKGCIQMKGAGEGGESSQVTQMYIGGQDYKTGMCIIYAALGHEILLSTYIPRDENKRLNQRLLANYRLPAPDERAPYLEAELPQISDIQYHAPSNYMLVSSRRPLPHSRPHTFMGIIMPAIDDVDTDPLCPRWLLPSFSMLHMAPSVLTYGNNETYCVAPAPASSPLLWVLGTRAGIVPWDGPEMPEGVPDPPQSDLLRDVFTVDFHPNMSTVIRFGGRPGVLFTADRRMPSAEWSHLRLPSSITHLRCLDGGNQVLVSGLRNQMGVYDLRFAREHRGIGDDGVKVDANARDGHAHAGNRNDRSRDLQQAGFRGRGRSRGRRGGKHANKSEHEKSNPRDKTVAQPVIRFEHYRNAAHTDIGFAYDPATGVVAAAHDDLPGTVALYSVRTGSRLRVLDFADTSSLPSQSSEARADLDNSTPRKPQPILDVDRVDLPIVQSLKFQTFPGDHTPTLFVAGDRRGGITAFSFGVEDLEDEA